MIWDIIGAVYVGGLAIITIFEIGDFWLQNRLTKPARFETLDKSQKIVSIKNR
jgi:hypothetical protein